MRNDKRLIAVLVALPAFCQGLYAQIGEEELEGLERHRRPPRNIEVLQSVDSPQDTLSSTAGLVETWSFLEEEDRREEAATAAAAETAAALDFLTVRGRIATLPGELTVPYRDELGRQVETYVLRHGKALRRILGRYLYYEPYIRVAFLRHSLPSDLTALAIVESAMNPLAVSRVGATGMWQFMPEAARQYGLRCDRSVDERLDPLRSADAAARYLKDAYRRLGDWPLAIASYNCGPAAVESAIRKAGSREFWQVYPYLPKETRGYLPAFVAALYTIEYYGLHGIEPIEYDQKGILSLRIDQDLTFGTITWETGVSAKTLRELNPQYKKGFIPGGQKNYILRIPQEYAEGLINLISR